MLVDVVLEALGVSGNELARTTKAAPIAVSRRRRGVYPVPPKVAEGYMALLRRCLWLSRVQVVMWLNNLSEGMTKEDEVMAKVVENEVTAKADEGLLAAHLEAIARGLLKRRGYEKAAAHLLSGAAIIKDAQPAEA